MGRSLVKTALAAYEAGDFQQALDLYKLAETVFEDDLFSVNIDYCKKRLASSTSMQSLKVACVMDEFTFHSYAPECNLLQLTPENVLTELEQ